MRTRSPVLSIYLVVVFVLSACAQDAPARQSVQVEPQTATRSASLTPDPHLHTATRTATTNPPSPTASSTATYDPSTPTISRTSLPSYTPRPTRTPRPTQPPTSTPDATSTAEAAFYNDQPVCQFDPSAAPAQASSQDIDTFQFSEPRFVYKREHLSTVLRIGEWVPETNQVSFWIYDNEKTFIGTVDGTTKALTTYMDAELGLGVPSWIPRLGRMAFGARQATAPYTGTVFVYTSPDQAPEVLFRDVFAFQWNTDRTGMLIQDAQSQRRPVIRSLSADTPPAVTQHLEQIGETLDWRLPPTVQLFLDQPARIEITWGGPEDRFLALFSKQGLFLADLVEDTICRLGYDGESWPMGAQWSPDGRFLAVGIAPLVEPPFTPIFEVIDMVNGEHIRIPFKNLYVLDMTWSADSRILLISAKERSIDSEEHFKLMLVDLVQQKRRVMHMQPPFLSGDDGQYNSYSLRWSPDGKQIAFFAHLPPDPNLRPLLSKDSGIYVIDVK